MGTSPTNLDDLHKRKDYLLDALLCLDATWSYCSSVYQSIYLSLESNSQAIVVKVSHFLKFWHISQLFMWLCNFALDLSIRLYINFYCLSLFIFFFSRLIIYCHDHSYMDLLDVNNTSTLNDIYKLASVIFMTWFKYKISNFDI